MNNKLFKTIGVKCYASLVILEVALRSPFKIITIFVTYYRYIIINLKSRLFQ